MAPSLELSRRLPPNEVARAGMALVFAFAAGCGSLADLGFTNRVLHDVASPDGRFRAICQEVPALDGPEFSTRLHRADGGFVANLAYGGDASRCREIAWSPDGSRLAVLNHASRITLVDAAGAMRGNAGRQSNRDVSLTWPEAHARNIRFVSETVIEFDACDAKNYSVIQGCLVSLERRRMDVSTTPARGVRLPSASTMQ